MTAALLLAVVHPWFPWFPLIPLAFFAFFVFAFFTFGRRCGRPYSRRSGEAVLAERYARGEIEESEYQQRRRVLRSIE
jgi:putative membrane protein